MFKQNEDLFNILLGAVSEGVIVVDVEQKIIDVNASAIEMFGYPRQDFVGLHLNAIIPSEYHAEHSGHVNKFMEKKEKRQMGVGRDIYGLRRNGEVFPLEAGLNPFQVGRESYVLAMVIDITERKQQELQIRQLNLELEKKVEARTKDLNIAIDTLKGVNLSLDIENKKRIKAEEEAQSALKKEKELNELKTKFLSLVSHEFKTPLSGILTSTILLSKYKLTEQQEKRDKHIETITSKVHYLNAILNDFLSFEKLESGKISYKFSSFKLSKVVNEVIYNANMLLKEGQRIHYPEDIDAITLYQDEKIIELSLSNLVHNALKYSPEHTMIDIFVSQDETHTTFKIKDQGCGIPQEDQKNIFNRYFRAENVLLTQGTGIGLNIVQSHLENLGGTISFESVENIGSTFTIIIPNTAN